MTTGIAGLMENVITLNTRIDDESPWTKDVRYGQAPRCWVKNPARHSNQTIVEGLQNSCNYFFFTVADGLGMNLLGKWGEFGLASSTGIELPGEAIGQIGNQQILFDPEKPINRQDTSMPQLVKNAIRRVLNNIEESRDVEYDEQLLDATAEQLVYLAGISWTADRDDNNILKDKTAFRWETMCAVYWPTICVIRKDLTRKRLGYPDRDAYCRAALDAFYDGGFRDGAGLYPRRLLQLRGMWLFCKRRDGL